MAYTQFNTTWSDLQLTKYNGIVSFLDESSMGYGNFCWWSTRNSMQFAYNGSMSLHQDVNYICFSLVGFSAYSRFSGILNPKPYLKFASLLFTVENNVSSVGYGMESALLTLCFIAVVKLLRVKKRKNNQNFT